MLHKLSLKDLQRLAREFGIPVSNTKRGQIDNLLLLQRGSGRTKPIIRRKTQSPIDIAINSLKKNIEELRNEKLENIEEPDELYLFSIYLPSLFDLSRFSKDFEEDEEVLSVVSLTEPDTPNKPYMANNSVYFTRRELVTILQKLFVNEDIEIEDYEQIPPMLNNSEVYVDNFIAEAENQARNRWTDENTFTTEDEEIFRFSLSKEILENFPNLVELVESKDAYGVVSDNGRFFITDDDANKLQVSREQLISLLANVLKSASSEVSTETFSIQREPDTNQYSLDGDLDDVYTISYDQALDLIVKTIDLYTPKKRRELARSDDMDEDDELIRSMKKTRV